MVKHRNCVSWASEEIQTMMMRLYLIDEFISLVPARAFMLSVESVEKIRQELVIRKVEFNLSTSVKNFYTVWYFYLFFNDFIFTYFIDYKL